MHLNFVDPHCKCFRVLCIYGLLATNSRNLFSFRYSKRSISMNGSLILKVVCAEREKNVLQFSSRRLFIKFVFLRNHIINNFVSMLFSQKRLKYLLHFNFVPVAIAVSARWLGIDSLPSEPPVLAAQKVPIVSFGDRHSFPANHAIAKAVNRRFLSAHSAECLVHFLYQRGFLHRHTRRRCSFHPALSLFGGSRLLRGVGRTIF